MSNLGRWSPILICSALLAASLPAWAELPGGIRVTANVEPEKIAPGKSARLAVTVHLPSGWIIYDLEQVPHSVLPTTIELEPHDQIAVVENFKSSGAKEDVEPKFGRRIARFFDRTPTFWRPIVAGPTARPGEQTLSGRIGFLAQHRPSKRFYLVSRAFFTAKVMIELPPPPTSTTDIAPAETTQEDSISPSEIERLLEEEKPKHYPAPAPFVIEIEPSRGPTSPSYTALQLIHWFMVGASIAIVAVILRLVTLS